MASAPFKILLVDDNEFVLRPLARYLSEEGFEVLEARDGREALDRVHERVDLVILDIMMPGMSGLEVLEAMRQSYSEKELPVLMATASSGSEQIVRAFELGANDYVTKPLDLPVVRARLHSRLRARTPRRSVNVDRPFELTSGTQVKPGSVLDGTYRLESLIGQGNFAEVYRATHLKLDRQVAIKLLRTKGQDEDEIRERFLREGRSTCRIEHPNAVSVLDANVTSAGVPFLVTELLRGKTLSDEIESRGPLSVSRCAEILLPICDVLAEAHRLGIVHRDIKPQNIFLHRSPRGEIVKVLDFGIAKLIGNAASQSRLTLSGSGPGTPAYMAPERFSSREVSDAKTDVYSLGVMLFKMLAGQLPFAPADGNLIKLALMHQHEAPAKLTDFLPLLTPEIEAVVMRTLEKDPSRRPTAREVAAQYGAALGLDVLAPIRERTGARAILDTCG